MNVTCQKVINFISSPYVDLVSSSRVFLSKLLDNESVISGSSCFGVWWSVAPTRGEGLEQVVSRMWGVCSDASCSLPPSLNLKTWTKHVCVYDDLLVMMSHLSDCDVTVSSQLLSEEVPKGSDESSNHTGNTVTFGLPPSLRGCTARPLNPWTPCLGDSLLLSDWSRKAAGAVHGDTRLDVRTDQRGWRRGRPADPAGAGGGAFLQRRPARRWPGHRPAEPHPPRLWPLTSSGEGSASNVIDQSP